MNPEEQRIAIAEACGWIFEEDTDGSITIISPSKQLRSSYHPTDVEFGFSTASRIVSLPDYLNDLNAMHEAEKVLPLKRWNQYVVNLARVIANAEPGDKVQVPANVLISATASQRAKAFLRTIGKWKD